MTTMEFTKAEWEHMAQLEVTAEDLDLVVGAAIDHMEQQQLQSVSARPARTAALRQVVDAMVRVFAPAVPSDVGIPRSDPMATTARGLLVASLAGHLPGGAPNKNLMLRSAGSALGRSVSAIESRSVTPPALVDDAPRSDDPPDLTEGPGLDSGAMMASAWSGSSFDRITQALAACGEADRALADLLARSIIAIGICALVDVAARATERLAVRVSPSPHLGGAVHKAIQERWHLVVPELEGYMAERTCYVGPSGTSRRKLSQLSRQSGASMRFARLRVALIAPDRWAASIGTPSGRSNLRPDIVLLDRLSPSYADRGDPPFRLKLFEVKPCSYESMQAGVCQTWFYRRAFNCPAPDRPAWGPTERYQMDYGAAELVPPSVLKPYVLDRTKTVIYPLAHPQLSGIVSYVAVDFNAPLQLQSGAFSTTARGLIPAEGPNQDEASVVAAAAVFIIALRIVSICGGPLAAAISAGSRAGPAVIAALRRGATAAFTSTIHAANAETDGEQGSQAFRESVENNLDALRAAGLIPESLTARAISQPQVPEIAGVALGGTPMSESFVYASVLAELIIKELSR